MQICEAEITKTRFIDHKKKPVYCWSDEIVELQKGATRQKGLQQER